MTILDRHKRITSIESLRKRVNIPTASEKIRLGLKWKTKDKEGKKGKKYPIELPFFMVPDEVADVYGFQSADEAVDQAKEMGVTRKDVLAAVKKHYANLAEELDVMIPMNDVDRVFPQALKWYGSGTGLKCHGNGQIGYRRNPEGGVEEIECPCEHLRTDENPKGECSLRADLFVILPKINMGKAYHITTGSELSVLNVQSGLDYTASLMEQVTGDRDFSLKPMILTRVSQETHGSGKKEHHYVMSLYPNTSVNALNEAGLNPKQIQRAETNLGQPKQIEAGREVYDDEERPEDSIPAEYEDVPIEEQSVEPKKESFNPEKHTPNEISKHIRETLKDGRWDKDLYDKIKTDVFGEDAKASAMTKERMIYFYDQLERRAKA